jgi:hypothetical protein
MLDFINNFAIAADASQVLSEYAMHLKAEQSMKMKEAIVGYIATGFSYLTAAGLIFMIGSLAAEMGRSLASAGSTAWNLTKKGAGAVIGGAKGAAYGMEEASLEGKSSVKGAVKKGYQGAVTGWDMGLKSIFKSPINEKLPWHQISATSVDGKPISEKDLFSPSQGSSLEFLTGGSNTLRSLEIKNPDKIPASKLSVAFNKVAMDGVVKLHSKGDTITYIRKGINFVSSDGKQNFSPEDLAKIYGRLA